MGGEGRGISDWPIRHAWFPHNDVVVDYSGAKFERRIGIEARGRAGNKIIRLVQVTFDAHACDGKLLRGSYHFPF